MSARRKLASARFELGRVRQQVGRDVHSAGVCVSSTAQRSNISATSLTSVKAAPSSMMAENVGETSSACQRSLGRARNGGIVAVRTQQEGGGVGEVYERAVHGVAKDTARAQKIASDSCRQGLASSTTKEGMHARMMVEALWKHRTQYEVRSIWEPGLSSAC